MNTRFCASCGTGNPYTAIKPTFCSKCGNAFEAAFAKAGSVPASVVTPTYAPQPQRPTKQYRPAQFAGGRQRQNVYDLASERAQEAAPQYDAANEDYVNKDEVYDAAQALASTIDPSDFVMAADRSTVTNSTSLLAPLLQQMQAAEAKSAPKARRGKKA